MNATSNKNTVETTIDITELAVASAEVKADAKTADAKTAVVKLPTEEQKAQIRLLREKAMATGGMAAALAAVKCNGTYSAADQYIMLLTIAVAFTPTVAAPAVAVPAVAVPAVAVRRTAKETYGDIATPKQWSFIKHLRSQLYRLGEGWALSMAKWSIGNNRREASQYIKNMIDALNSRKPKSAIRSGGMICCCGVESCRIGPMVSR